MMPLVKSIVRIGTISHPSTNIPKTTALVPLSVKRRNFLRGVGVMLGLPFLDAMNRRGALLNAAVPLNTNKNPTHMVCIGVHLSILPESSQSKGNERDYETTSLLKAFAYLRDKFSLFTDIDLPQIRRATTPHTPFKKD